jgi:DNA polymerase-1
MLTKDTDKKLFLLDAYALIYRSYFAFSKNPRINSKGMNTSAVFGFVNTLYDVISNEKPTHIAVVIDPPSPPKRAEDYTEYKANREDTPEDIKQSVPYIKKLLEGFNIPLVMADGYEADDVIGTLAHQAEKEGFITYMMTPDKDFAQLVSENVFMYKPSRMGNAAEVWGIPEVKKKFSIEQPEQVIDILGMWGDAVDNIPGVPGIGEKRAKKLVGEYGSMEEVYEHLEDFKGKMKENLENNREQAFMSKMLATILIDAPVEFNAKEYEKSDWDKEALKEIFTDLEFRRMSERILGEKIAPTEGQMDMFATGKDGDSGSDQEETEIANLESTDHDYKLVDSDKAIVDLTKKLLNADVFCFDTETTSVDAHNAELVGLAFSLKKGEAYYVPFPQDRDECLKKLKKFDDVFKSKALKIGHNVKYDLNVLKHHEMEVSYPLFDTMIAHYLTDPENNRRSMDVLAETYLYYRPKPISDLIGKKGKNQKSMREVAIEDAAEYAGEDADITLQLKGALEKDLKKGKEQKIFDDIEMPLVNVLSDMECEGIKMDRDILDDYSKNLQKEISSIEKEIYEIAGHEFNIGSPKQVGEVLFDELKVTDKPKKTKSGQYATNEEALQSIAGKHEIVEQILEYREVVKLKNTYVDPLPNLINERSGRIHTTFNQVRAATGRLSSDKPNLQNIPIRTERGRYIRQAFVPRNDDFTLMAADYSQVELRIIAALAEEENMQDAFNSGIDIHATTASKVFGVELDDVTREMRSNAKTVNFGIIYGISAYGLSQRINISRKEAKDIIDNYFDKYPKIKTYMDKQIEYAREHGYVETVLGRRRYLRDINSRNGTVRGFAERNAINSPIQGTAADLIKIAMINVHKKLNKDNYKSKMLLQVHDELVFDCHKDEQEKLIKMVSKEMSGALDLNVELEVEAQTGSNWLEAH